MANASESHGKFCWQELMTSDLAAAGKFYGELFGWQFEKSPDPSHGSYTLIKLGGKAVGGVMPQPPQCKNMLPAWGLYIAVTSADETAAMARKLGGKVFAGPEDIPNVGRFAVLQDPQGAVFMILQPSGQPHAK
jgi:predicted enzyme related to lactoylglutathione lyase